MLSLGRGSLNIYTLRKFKIRLEKKFSYINHLLINKNAKIEGVSYKLKKGREEECKIAQLISRYGKLIENFGFSDCKFKGQILKK